MAFLLASTRVSSALEVSQIFSDHMVLQRRMPVPVWGWAEPGEEVTVALGEQTKTAQANEAGKWMVRFDPMETGAPRQMSVRAKSGELKIDDILLGEVWLASGQSNMGFYLSEAQDAEKAIQSANLPNVRLFNMAKDDGDVRAQNGPAERIPVHPEVAKMPPTTWQVCSPETARDHFSAVAFYFARGLQADLKVPVGIISNPVGGSAIEMWISRSAFEADPDFKVVPQYYDRLVSYAQTPEGEAERAKLSAAYEARQAELKTQGKYLLWPTHFPEAPTRDSFASVWFNTRVNPLIPFAMRGVIWYQGEGNGYWKDNPDYPLDYRALFPLLIRDWRARWGEGDFPFLFVQLPNWGQPQPEPGDGGGWALVREAQEMALQIPHTGMAVAIDVGDPAAIHPKNKEPVGDRLALTARAVAYGEKLVYSGPLYREMKVEGHAIRLFFDHVGSGLDSRGEELKRFAIAGADGKFVWAQAKIDGETVVVSAPEVSAPAVVRYAWETNPEGCNLRNKEGLPASPFRTDQAPSDRAACYKRLLLAPPTLRLRL